MLPYGSKNRLRGRIPEGSVSTQSQRALLLRDSVSEFERRVNAIFDYEETHPQATLGELEAEARWLSRDCFAPVLEGLLRWRSQEMEGFPRCGSARSPGTRVSSSGAKRPLREESPGGGAITTVRVAAGGATL